jgi:Trk K+ transport system NAD-binding subunit
MNIMIIGCGRVGSQLALLLSQEGHNVTIIDKKDESFKRLGGSFNGVAATGNGFGRVRLGYKRRQYQSYGEPDREEDI